MAATSTIGSTGMLVSVRIGVSGSREARTSAPPTTSAISANERSAFRSRPSPSASASPTAMIARTRKNRPTIVATASPAVCAVSTKLGITAGHACDPGLTDSTPTTAQRGRLKIHRTAGNMITAAPASRASRQVIADAPCHSSATK